MRKLLTGIMCLATGAALWCATPDEALAQKRGGERGNRGGGNRGNNNAGRVYSTPNPGYRGTDWRGSNWGGWNYGGWNSGYGYYPFGYGYGFYPFGYGLNRGYRSGYYPDSYPSNDYSTTTEEYPSYVGQRAPSNTAQLRVQVPDPNAQVWLNGAGTNLTGTSRVFVTPPLSGNYTHTYEVHARWMNPDGQMLDQVRNVEVQPGQEVIVNFS